MALPAEDGHELFPDEPAAADHHDLHDEPPRLWPAGCGRLECQILYAMGYRMRPALLVLLPTFLGDDDVLGVLRVHDDDDKARLVLLAGVPADSVQAAGRLIEGVPGVEELGFVVV